MSSNLSDKELRRYMRQTMLPEIGEEGQMKLKLARVLVIGVGGLGTTVLQYLTASGVGHIGIVDDDTLSEYNLQRQILFGDKDIGKLKAIVARERLAALNPMTEFEVHNVRMEKNNILEIIGNNDIVVDATDNFPTRYLINDACIIRKIPWVHGAIYNYEGQVSVFNYEDGPTYRCLYPEKPEESNIDGNIEAGILGVLPGITGCYLANEVIKIIIGFGKILSGSLLKIDLRNNRFHTFAINAIQENKHISSL